MSKYNKQNKPSIIQGQVSLGKSIVGPGSLSTWDVFCHFSLQDLHGVIVKPWQHQSQFAHL